MDTHLREATAWQANKHELHGSHGLGTAQHIQATPKFIEESASTQSARLAKPVLLTVPAHTEEKIYSLSVISMQSLVLLLLRNLCESA